MSGFEPWLPAWQASTFSILLCPLALALRLRFRISVLLRTKSRLTTGAFKVLEGLQPIQMKAKRVSGLCKEVRSWNFCLSAKGSNPGSISEKRDRVWGKMKRKVKSSQGMLKNAINSGRDKKLIGSPSRNLEVIELQLVLYLKGSKMPTNLFNQAKSCRWPCIK